MYKDFDDQFKDIHPLVDYTNRESFIQSIKDKVNSLFPSNSLLTNTIKEDGYVALGKLLNDTQISEIKEHLFNKLAFDSHVPPGSSGKNTIEQIRKRKSSACYDLHDILTCPHILELALSRDILSIAEDYLECAPTLYSINIFHTFVEHSAIEGIKSFHRDADDAKFLCLFIYLVDVDEDTGPHIYIKYTHNEKQFLKNIKNTNDVELCYKIFPPAMLTGHGNDRLFESELSQYIYTLTGPAGSGFFADTFGLHRGSALSKDRLILWIRYGLHKNAPAKDQIPHSLSKEIIKDKNIVFDDKLNYITRVILNV